MRALLFLPLLALLAACHHHPPLDPADVQLGVANAAAPRVPSLAVTDHTGATYNLKEKASGPYAAIFFYPVADTPG